MMRLQVDRPDFRAAFAKLQADNVNTIRHVLQMIGQDVVDYLRSLTDEMAPPIGSRLVTTKARRRRGGEREQGPLELGKRRRWLNTVPEIGPVQATPARRTLGDGRPRQAHPGHWSDITGDLARAYAWDVAADGTGATLTLQNTMEYAVHLEKRDGYFVLGGIMEAGGPVHQALVRAAAIVAPSWRVVVEPAP